MSREMDLIYGGLHDGLHSTEALLARTSGAEAYDRLRFRRDEIKRAIDAYHILCMQIRDGKRHIEPPEDAEPHTTCYCSTTSHPPCSVCCP